MKKKTTTNQIRTSIRNILHAANRRLQRFYNEFTDILDSDEDRLALQFNGGNGNIERKSQRATRFTKRSS